MSFSGTFSGTADRFPRSDRSASATLALRQRPRFTRERRTLVRASPVRKDALVESGTTPSIVSTFGNVLSRSGVLAICWTVATLTRRFASLSLAHEFIRYVRCFLPLDLCFSLVSRQRKNQGWARTTDICLPKPQLRAPASRAFPVPRQSFHPGGENELWGPFSMPETLAFHDAQVAWVGDDLPRRIFRDDERSIHRTS